MKMVALRTVLVLTLLVNLNVIVKGKSANVHWTQKFFPLSRILRSVPPPAASQRNDDSGSGSGSDMICSQQQAQELMGDLPADCVGYLYSESPTFRDIDFSQSYPGLCTACGDPLYVFFRTCFTNSLAETMDQQCATNRMGSRCHAVFNMDGVQDCVGQDMCSSGCRSYVSSRMESQGCCFYSGVRLNMTREVADRLWDSCDLSTPRLCDGAFSSSAREVKLCTLLMSVAVLLGVVSVA